MVKSSVAAARFTKIFNSGVIVLNPELSVLLLLKGVMLLLLPLLLF
jgi:hypothetical protein